MRTVKCRYCPAQIAFVKTPAGKALPVNPRLQAWDPQQDAGAMVVTPEGEVGRMGVKFTTLTEGYTPHWQICPGAKDARRDSLERRKKEGRDQRRREFRRDRR